MIGGYLIFAVPFRGRKDRLVHGSRDLDFRYQDINMETEYGDTKDKFQFTSYYLTSKFEIHYDLTRKP